MVKLYVSLLALTLATTSALAAPYQGIRVVQRDLDHEFSRREYLLNARDTFDAYHEDFVSRGLGQAYLDDKKRKADLSAYFLNGAWNGIVKGYRYVKGKIQKLFGHDASGQPESPDRRGLEDDEELLRRYFDAEELFEREYDDILAERDAFDLD